MLLRGHQVPTFLAEVILCTKELNGETRVEAYNVLLGLGYHLQARTPCNIPHACTIAHAHVVVVIVITGVCTCRRTCARTHAHARNNTRRTVTHARMHAHADAHADAHRPIALTLGCNESANGRMAPWRVQERPESGGARKLVEMAVAGLAGQV